DLAPDEVVRVIGDAHLVRFGIANADRGRGWRHVNSLRERTSTLAMDSTETKANRLAANEKRGRTIAAPSSWEALSFGPKLRSTGGRRMSGIAAGRDADPRWRRCSRSPIASRARRARGRIPRPAAEWPMQRVRRRVRRSVAAHPRSQPEYRYSGCGDRSVPFRRVKERCLPRSTCLARSLSPRYCWQARRSPPGWRCRAALLLWRHSAVPCA